MKKILCESQTQKPETFPDTLSREFLQAAVNEATFVELPLPTPEIKIYYYLPIEIESIDI